MVARNALGHARVMQVIDDHRADNPRRRPCGEQTAMNGADIPRAENIREIGRHGSKSAAYTEAMMQNAAAKTTTALMPARVGATA